MNPEPMELFIQIKTEMRQADDAILKKHGISWAKWIDLSAEVERSFPDEGVTVNGLEFRVEKKDIELFRKIDCQVIGQTKRVSVHQTR